MKYMGSKARIAKEILPIILKDRKPDQWFIDLFAGGMNLIDKVSGKRIANDLNPYLIAMWDQIVNRGWRPKDYYKREEYLHIYQNIDKYPAHVVGWVGFNCSYRVNFLTALPELQEQRKVEKETIRRKLSDTLENKS